MDLFASLVGLLFAAFFLIHGLQLLFARSKKLPPGPTPLPIIGHLHLLGDKPHQSMAQLAKIHGPLMHLRLSFTHAFVVSSAALAKEVLQKQGLVFSSRKIANALQAHDHSKYSVLHLPVASRWRSLRKVLSTIIFSKNCLDANERLRSRKVQELISYCRNSSHTGEAVNISHAALTTVLIILSDTIFSKDFSDPFGDSTKELREIVCNMMVEANKPNMVDFFPVLDKIDPQGIRRRMTIHFGKMIDLVKGLMEERLERRKSENAGTSDVSDLLLATIKENPEEIDITHIEHLCLDIFAAGTDTTSSTIEWAMAEAFKNPETMKIAKSELEEVIGKGRVVNEADLPRLPYLLCMVKETMRLHPVVPLVVRDTVQDAELCGYTVPKNAPVIVNIWAIGREADSWANPLEFKPERFMESQADVHGTDFELIPFGAGRRICPGLALAMRTVPVMLGSLLNSFDWKLEGGIGHEELDMEEKFGITLQKAHPLRAVPIPM